MVLSKSLGSVHFFVFKIGFLHSKAEVSRTKIKLKTVINEIFS